MDYNVRIGRLALCVTLVGLSAVALRGSLTQGSQAGAVCVGTLDGAKFPSQVPAVLAWSDAVETIRAGPSSSTWTALADATGLRGDDVPSLGSIVASAVAAPNQSTGPVRSPSGIKMDSAPTAHVLRVRDELLRVLPDDVALALEDWVAIQVTQRSYDIAVPGKLVALSTGGTRCRVSVNGREHFSFVPDGYVWEFYFRIRASAAKTMEERGNFTAHLKVLREAHVPISYEELAALIAIAKETTAEVDVLRQSPDDEFVRVALAKTVLTGRRRLMRAVSAASWQTVLADVRTATAGTIYDLPTGI